MTHPLQLADSSRGLSAIAELLVSFCLLVSLIFRPRRSRSAAAYSRQLSRGRSVGPYVPALVGRSVQCVEEKRRGSDPDAVWHRRSDESRDEAGSGVWR